MYRKSYLIFSFKYVLLYNSHLQQCRPQYTDRTELCNVCGDYNDIPEVRQTHQYGAPTGKKLNTHLSTLWTLHQKHKIDTTSFLKRKSRKKGRSIHNLTLTINLRPSSFHTWGNELWWDDETHKRNSGGWTIPHKELGKLCKKLNCTTPETYRKIIKHFKENNTYYNTYQIKEERAYRLPLHWYKRVPPRTCWTRPQSSEYSKCEK